MEQIDYLCKQAWIFGEFLKALESAISKASDCCEFYDGALIDNSDMAIATFFAEMNSKLPEIVKQLDGPDILKNTVVGCSAYKRHLNHY